MYKLIKIAVQKSPYLVVRLFNESWPLQIGDTGEKQTLRKQQGSIIRLVVSRYLFITEA